MVGEKVRVVMAMSGGVDSCVAAAILQEQGYDVVGITMQLWNHAGSGEERFDSCCSLTDVHDARRAAHKMGIPHYVVNYEDEFRKGVVDYFAREYKNGRTPNPCVLCNSKLKFDHLLERARALGADWVATGHYARIERTESGAIHLLKGKDDRKDQSYFLFDTNPDNLKHAVFPLGNMTKPEVREKARQLGMHTAEKHESQEICFVSGKRYTDFLNEHYGSEMPGDGNIVDLSGRVLGRHRGIHMYTVGQRKGLGHLATTEPLYVARLEPDSNQVVVASSTDLSVASFLIDQPNWLGEAPEEDTVLSVMVRYRAQPIACTIRQVSGEQWEVRLAEPAKWVTPGQAAVLYDGERVLGGGFIASKIQVSQDRAEAEIECSDTV